MDGSTIVVQNQYTVVEDIASKVMKYGLMRNSMIDCVIATHSIQTYKIYMCNLISILIENT
jgi:hypothetical protein